MKLVIISGRSGSGKTIALHALEDLGYYCVDNLPISILPQLDREIGGFHPKIAISIDSRNIPEDLSQLRDIIESLTYNSNNKNNCRVIYLDAEDNLILQRFSETRRKHPLTSNKTSLREAIKQERKLLAPIASLANYTIDTSRLSQHELHGLLRERFYYEHKKGLQILIQSFGFKFGLPPDADFVFDIRYLPNPFWEPSLKEFTGKDVPVIEYLDSKSMVSESYNMIYNFLDSNIINFRQNNRSYLNVSIGCTGGRHRSVFLAEKISKGLQATNEVVLVRHRELQL